MVLALALMMAGPARAEGEVLDVARATVTLQDGRTVAVSEGCWLSTERCILTARELRRLQAENEVLRQQPRPAPVVAVLMAVALGVGVGFTAARVLR
ncbi:hypothetical protein D7Y13_01410 [Corallococcus praedator]|uniref:Uncharacterized protein n=1 Tax=Corallococcus praedator TaxID=2316724 RepID=A0ABX9QQU6_9BACT|nr:hypothetical protein D7X75_06265 [Corallococcus sp. CA031C]RKI17116.1 hypothetical protein D7Y13_01410 [Corallococcus praedator]